MVLSSLVFGCVFGVFGFLEDLWLLAFGRADQVQLVYIEVFLRA